MDALKKIQQELKAPKNQFNKFGGFKYRSAEDILEAVKPLLGKYDAQLTLSDEIVEIGGRVYVKATAKICDEKVMTGVEVSAFAREPDEKKGMDASQVTGTASSYARKYALNGLFLIDDTKDADTDEYRAQSAPAPKETAPKTKGLTKATIESIEQLIVSTGSNRQALLDFYKVSRIEDMSQENAKHCIGVLKGRLNG